MSNPRLVDYHDEWGWPLGRSPETSEVKKAPGHHFAEDHLGKDYFIQEGNGL